MMMRRLALLCVGRRLALLCVGRRLALLCVGLLLLYGQAHGQMLLGVSGWEKASSGGGYTGIGDVSAPGTPIIFWSGECYSKSGTNNVAQVQYPSGTNVALLGCQNGAYYIVSGTYSLATLKSTCSTPATCIATEAYDQTNSNACGSAGTSNCNGSAAGTVYIVYTNGTNANGANAGVFVFQSPATGGDFFISGNSLPAIAQPINAMCSGTYGGGSDLDIIQTNAGAFRLSFTSPTANAYAGTNQAVYSSVSNNAWFMMAASFDGATASYAQFNNDTPVTASTGTNTIGSGDYFLVGWNWLGGIVGTCFVTKGTAWGATAMSNMLAVEAAHFGGGIP